MITRDYQIVDSGVDLYPYTKYESDMVFLDKYVQFGVYLKFDIDNIPKKPLILKIYISPDETKKTNMQNKVFYIFPEMMSNVNVYKEIPITTGKYVHFELFNSDDTVIYSFGELGIQRVSY